MQTIQNLVSTAMKELSTPPASASQYPTKFADGLAFKTCGDPELEKLVQACWEWYEAFNSKQKARWISMLGNSGTGKTHCAERLWGLSRFDADFSKCEYTEQKIVWPRFVQKLRAGDSYAMRDDLIRWPVLFLDDIGSERDPSGFATEELVTLLMSRMNKWTIITSNKTPEALRAIDERIYSRLIRDLNICVTVNAADFATR